MKYARLTIHMLKHFQSLLENTQENDAIQSEVASRVRRNELFPMSSTITACVLKTFQKTSLRFLGKHQTLNTVHLQQEALIM